MTTCNICKKLEKQQKKAINLEKQVDFKIVTTEF